VGGIERTSAHGAGRRPVAAILASAILASAILAAAASSAGARPPIVDARHRADALGHHVEGARHQAARLQTRILGLASTIAATRRALDRLQGRLVEAQHGLTASQAELDAIQARLDERAREAFIALGSGASAAYLLEADSFADLMDRAVMLDRMQRSDADLGDAVSAEAARFATAQVSLERATAERGHLLSRLASRSVVLLDAFAAQQAALQQLIGRQQDAVRDVKRLERRAARRAGALPFGDWAGRFLDHLGAPSCRDNLVVVMAWQANEFTQARWNPLATTHRMHRSTGFNAVGVQNYVSLTQGLRASAQTLSGGAASYGYGAILDALDRCADAMSTAGAIRASAWCRGCSNGGYVTELVPIVEEYFDRYIALHV
jgi:peptidoglycan hydrolase CwlO-like protein